MEFLIEKFNNLSVSQLQLATIELDELILKKRKTVLLAQLHEAHTAAQTPLSIIDLANAYHAKKKAETELETLLGVANKYFTETIYMSNDNEPQNAGGVEKQVASLQQTIDGLEAELKQTIIDGCQRLQSVLRKREEEILQVKATLDVWEEKNNELQTENAKLQEKFKAAQALALEFEQQNEETAKKKRINTLKLDKQ